MKTFQLILLSCLTLMHISCESDDSSSGEKAIFAVPEVMSLTELRSNVAVTSAQQTQSDGKIYVAENYLFYIAKESGVHVFDNSNPAAPQNAMFISIPGVHDIAVMNDRLYADNYIDMLVFDISNMQNITLIQTLENVFDYYPVYPETAEFYDYTVTAGTNEIITGFTLESRDRPAGGDIQMANDALEVFSGAAEASGAGTGGSYARFQINGDALYAVEQYHLNVFNIGNPQDAFFDKEVYMNAWFGGGEFETLFRQKEYLFIGSTTGMFVVNAEDEFNPYFMSGFSHATACDPVVVDGTTAYITVRGGTTCGAIEDQVNVIDITDMNNPTLLSTYMLNQPYGLGIRGDVLYVCTGTGGLKIFDASNSVLTLENSYADNVIDVIPMVSHLIAVGPNSIRQYNYGSNFTLEPISTVNF